MKGGVLPMAKNTEKTTTATEAPVVETEEKAVVKETPVVEPAKTVEAPKKEAVKTESAKNEPELIVGRTKVTLKESCKETVVGLPIPEFAYKNVYLVKAVLTDRVIIGVDLYEGYCLPVTEKDINIIIG